MSSDESSSRFTTPFQDRGGGCLNSSRRLPIAWIPFLALAKGLILLRIKYADLRTPQELTDRRFGTDLFTSPMTHPLGDSPVLLIPAGALVWVR